MKHISLVLGVILAIAGCGIQSSDLKLNTTFVKAKTTRTAFFPAQVGYTWQYDVVLHPSDESQTDSTGTETLKTTAVNQVNGKTVLELSDEDSFIWDVRRPIVEMDEQGVTIKDTTYIGPAADIAKGHSIDFLHIPLQVGAKWDDGLWIGKVKGQETIQVPAGTYETYKIEIIGAYDHAYSAVGDYWVAPGVGIVKSDLTCEQYQVTTELRSAGVSKRK